LPSDAAAGWGWPPRAVAAVRRPRVMTIQLTRGD